MKERQKAALEKITGKAWDTWNPEAVRAYFSFTDRGRIIRVSPEAQADLDELVFCHKRHAVDVELWKEDFKSGQLSLNDFIHDVPQPPDNFLKHVFEVYREVKGWIPSRWGLWAEKLGVDCYK